MCSTSSVWEQTPDAQLLNVKHWWKQPHVSVLFYIELSIVEQGIARGVLQLSSVSPRHQCKTHAGKCLKLQQHLASFCLRSLCLHFVCGHFVCTEYEITHLHNHVSVWKMLQWSKLNLPYRLLNSHFWFGTLQNESTVLILFGFPKDNFRFLNSQITSAMKFSHQIWCWLKYCFAWQYPCHTLHDETLPIFQVKVDIIKSWHTSYFCTEENLCGILQLSKECLGLACTACGGKVQ